MLDISQTEQSSTDFQEPFLNSDTVNWTLTDEQAEFINELLENPPPPTPAMKELLALASKDRVNHKTPPTIVLTAEQIKELQDILDNPFETLDTLEQALLERGYKIVKL